jgi:tRNA U38,U39,U40 pseudouridine synthase TruA
MDIERTMRFIIDNLAAVTAAQQQAEVRAARTDRQIHGLQTLVKIGMRRLVKLEQGQIDLQKAMREMAVAQKELAESQKRTDQKFERWLDSLKGRNGKRAK